MSNTGLVPYEGKKKKTSGSGVKKCEPLESGDMTAILNMAVESCSKRMGRPAEYPATAAGLDAFINKTIDYFQYVNNINADPELERKLIPDIESWAVFLGITRQTILNYQGRGKEWRETIEYYKGVVGAIKKQLALNYKIPPMVYVFDSVNNHNYLNSTEFKMTSTTVEKPRNTALDEEVAAAGLVWNETKEEFEPID